MKKLQLLFALAFFSMGMNGQISAEFSASTTTGCGGASVDFLDESTSNGNITSWLWDFGNGQTSTQQNPSIDYLTTGSFTVCLTVNDDLGQNDMLCKSDFIVINPAPVCIIDMNIPMLSCNNPTVTLDGSQSSTGTNFTYSWTTTNGNILSGSTTMNAIVDTAGFYTLEVTDTINNCSSVITIEVTGNVYFPIADVSATNNVDTINCSTSSFTLPVNLDGSNSSTGPNIVYEWYDINNVLIGDSIIVEVNDIDPYHLVVRDTVLQCSDTAYVIFSIYSDLVSPNVIIAPVADLTCVNNSVILDGSGSSTGSNFIYEWISNGTVIATTPTVTVMTSGIFEFTVTNIDNGCTASDQVLVTEDTNIIAININATTIACPGDLVTIDMSPPCMNCAVEILDAMGNPVCTTGLPCEIDPAAGPFQITVTDLNNGCENSESLTFLVSNPIVLAQSTTIDVSCFGETDGAIDIDIAGGSSPYIFNWSNGSMNEDQSGLAPGDYFVSVIDANGCELVENFTILEPGEILITNALVNNVSCMSSNDGSIDLTIEGGTLPYNFSSNLTNLVVGNYSVTITDVNGCSMISPDYEVIQNICFDFANDTTFCVGGTVPLSNETATAGYNYSWTPTTGLNDPTISNPIASPTETTTYFLTITDGNGTVIFNAQGPTVTVQNYLDFGLLDFSNAPLCEGDTLELYGNVGLIFAWTGPNSFSSSEMDPVIYTVTELDAGTYNLAMTDEFGCTASASVDVFIDDNCVWPGDTDTNMVVNHFDLLNIGLAYDSVGTIRENASFDWFAQPALDWSQSTPTSNVNYKHIDADGNGIIEAADTVAITQNLGLTHNFVDPIDNQFTDLPPTDGFTVITPFYVEPDTLIEGETIALDLILGDVSNLVVGLYGIGFSIEYDSSVVVPGSASINFDNCWLGDVNADAISIQFDFPSPGRIDAAITRIDGMEMDGYGLFGEFIITLEDDILLWNGGGSSNNFGTTTDVTAEFAITNYHLINFSQEEIIVQGMTTTAPIEETTSLSFVELNELISVFPNPADDAFFIASQKLDMERVRIFSATGELKSMKTKTGNTFEFSTKELASGIYFVEIQTREGIVTKKLFVK